MLSYQLLKNAKPLGSTSVAPAYLPKEVACPGKTMVSSDVSTPSDLTEKPIIWSLVDANGKMHYLVKFDITKDPSGCYRTKKRKCKKFSETKNKQDARFHYLSYCELYSICTKIDGHDYFKSHVDKTKKTTKTAVFNSP